jgi:glyoxylase-like metal-dependent hydrolase (beta-lactamase superfamily II)
MNSSKITITAINGNSQRLDGGAMFGNAPRAVWERWSKPDELGRINLACRALLLKHKDRLILLETGIGFFFDQKMRDRFGVQGNSHELLEDLKKQGVSEEDITDVVLSHLHFDHAGGLLSPIDEGPFRLLFPNAKIFIGEKAWERAKHPHPRDRASFIPELNSLLEAEFQKQDGRVRLVYGDSHPELPPFLSFTYTEGHTPGQMHTIVNGDEQRVLFAGDLIPGRPWVHLPITMGYDRFPEKLIDEKKRLLESFSDSGDLIFYTHDAEVCASQVTFDGKRFKPDHEMHELASIRI